LLSLVAVVVGIMCSTMSWQVLLDDLGKPIGVGRGAQIFLVGQLGKYLPGSVWAYVLQIELGRKAGLARARVDRAGPQIGLASMAVRRAAVRSCAVVSPDAHPNRAVGIQTAPPPSPGSPCHTSGRDRLRPVRPRFIHL